MALRRTEFGLVHDTADMAWAQRIERSWYRELAIIGHILEQYINQERHHEPDSMDK